MNNKKGISPLIATVLIVGFTIVLAVLVITWISGTVSEQTETTDCQTEVSNVCLELVNKFEVQTAQPTMSTFTITVINSGNTALSNNAADPSKLVVIPVKMDGTTDTAQNLSVGAYATSSPAVYTAAAGTYSKIRLIPVIDNGECNAECTAIEVDV